MWNGEGLQFRTVISNMEASHTFNLPPQMITTITTVSRWALKISVTNSSSDRMWNMVLSWVIAQLNSNQFIVKYKCYTKFPAGNPEEIPCLREWIICTTQKEKKEWVSRSGLVEQRYVGHYQSLQSLCRVQTCPTIPAMLSADACTFQNKNPSNFSYCGCLHSLCANMQTDPPDLNYPIKYQIN